MVTTCPGLGATGFGDVLVFVVVVVVVVVVACGIDTVFVEHNLTSDRGYATHRF